jgi:spermidine/putrescine transport system permease protein
MAEITRVDRASSTLPRIGVLPGVQPARLAVRLGLPAIGFGVFAFLYLPIVVLIVFSFNTGKRMGIWEGFGLNWYASVLQDRQILRSVEVSLWIAVLSTILATIIGTLSALALDRFRFRGRSGYDAVLYLPVIIPDVVMALSLLLFFSSVNMQLSRWTVLIAHVAFNTAFVAVIVRARLAVLDRRLEEAAGDLYASPFHAFRRVTLPLLMPAIISGALLAFALSFDEVVITSFVNGQGDTTLPVRIYSMLRFGLKPEINAIAVMILVGSSILVVSSFILQNRGTAKPATR